MCRPASMIVTRSKVHWLPWCDSHEEIINHYKLDDSQRGGDFVRIEISPDDRNYRLPLKSWTYNVDQDKLPDWYDAREAEEAVRKELPKSAKMHIIKSGDVTIEESYNLSVIVLGGICNVIGQIGGSCRASGHSTLNAIGHIGGSCRAFGHSTLISTGQPGGICHAYGNAKKVVK